MNEEIRTAINKIIVQLTKEQGEVVPIREIVKSASEEGISEEDVHKEIDILVDEGMLVRLDETSVQLDM
jgi:hypothetical protein